MCMRDGISGGQRPPRSDRSGKAIVLECTLLSMPLMDKERGSFLRTNAGDRDGGTRAVTKWLRTIGALVIVRAYNV